MRTTPCRTFAARFALLALTATLAACSSLGNGFDTPGVSVTSFRSVPGNGVIPEFEIGLRVTNPNPVPLKLRGISYTISLDGRELVTGVNNTLPAVDAYGTGDVAISVVPDVIASIGLITDLLNDPRDSFSYALEAKLDVGRFLPAIRVRDAGELSLSSD